MPNQGEEMSPGEPQDPFEALLDERHVSSAPVEPSAEERRRASERAAREADLRRRLAEQEEHERSLAKRDRRIRTKARRRANGARSAVRRATGRSVVTGFVVLVLVGLLTWAVVAEGRGGLDFLGLGGGGSDSAAAPATSDTEKSATTSTRPSATLPGQQLDVRGLLGKVGPSVVSIHTLGPDGAAAGSGVVLSADGVILTNAHVVQGTQAMMVTFADGRNAPARLLGAVADRDVAVVRAERLQGPTTPAELGSSAELQVGDSVVAIGNALDLGDEPSVTTGIVSALKRSITDEKGTTLSDLVQTDAAVNHGNSGGPLINTRGQVVGINTAGSDEAQNISFAISIDSIRPVVEELRARK